MGCSPYPKNYPSVDIFGHNPKLDKDVRIQVKSASAEQNSFLIGFCHDNRGSMENDVEGPYIFIHFKEKTNPDYYILEKESLINLVISTDDAYFNRPRKKPIREDYPIAVGVKDLLPYKNLWK